MQEVRLKIRDVTTLGEGVGTYEGLTIFVEGALPEEVVLAEIYEKKSTYAKARLIKILEKSDSRVNPICPVFGKCGGCQIMHLLYEDQLLLKKKRIEDAFIRIGKLTNFRVNDVVASPKPLYYRNKITLPISKDLKFGLFAKRSHDIVSINTCYIQKENINQILGEIQLSSEIRNVQIRSNRKGESLVVLITRTKPSEKIFKLAKDIMKNKSVLGVLHGINNRDDNVLFADAYQLLEGKKVLDEEVLGIKVEISPTSFFQVNLEQAENLYLKAFELAEILPSDKVLDAYSGIGVFAAFLAKKGACVMGIEVVNSSVENAKQNALNNGVFVDYRLGKVEDLMDEVLDLDVIFINPPRKGAEEKVLESIAKKAKKKIIYTSCDPATLARDLHFLSKHGFNKFDAYPFDMFPQTMHVETVVQISRG
jgi:23S rRNA (uracil1939-C5)-methyltransferase